MPILQNIHIDAWDHTKEWKGLDSLYVSLCSTSVWIVLTRGVSGLHLRVSENECCAALSLPSVVASPLIRLNDASRSLKLLGRHSSPGLVHVLYRFLLSWFSSISSLEFINSFGRASGDFHPVGAKGEPVWGEQEEKISTVSSLFSMKHELKNHHVGAEIWVELLA